MKKFAILLCTLFVSFLFADDEIDFTRKSYSNMRGTSPGFVWVTGEADSSDITLTVPECSTCAGESGQAFVFGFLSTTGPACNGEVDENCYNYGPCECEGTSLKAIVKITGDQMDLKNVFPAA